MRSYEVKSQPKRNHDRREEEKFPKANHEVASPYAKVVANMTQPADDQKGIKSYVHHQELG